MSDLGFLFLALVFLGVFGGGCALGYWFRAELEHDDFVALDRARSARQGLASVHTLSTRDRGPAAS